jgi:hypothetical protein
MLSSLLELRRHELERRVSSLPGEVEAWIHSTQTEIEKNAYFSQLRAIELLIAEYTLRQGALLKQLDTASDPAAFQLVSYQLIESLTKSQQTWAFFREKLNLRHSPKHRVELLVADTIAWDCYRPVLDRAVQFGILHSSELREPPLVYCSADYSPATWVRRSRPYDGRNYQLGEALLPIPVIEIPWDTLGSSWEFLALHHEVGHDLEADLSLRPALLSSLIAELKKNDVPHTRIKIWSQWIGEVVADLCALQLAGPAFTDVLMHVLLLPEHVVKSFDPEDPHPTPFLRILLNSAYIRTLGISPALEQHAAAIEARWKETYGKDSGDAELDCFAGDFAHVFAALMDSPLPALREHTLRELIPFADSDDAVIRSAVKFFRTGANRPSWLPLRHTVSAARLALGEEADTGNLTTGICVDIHGRVLEYVKENTPKGLRGGGPDAHDKYIAGFADKIFPPWTHTYLS